MIKFSFEQRDEFGVNVQNVGLKNYKTVFSTPEYFDAFKNSIYYLVGSFIQLGLALFLATILCLEDTFLQLLQGSAFSSPT